MTLEKAQEYFINKYREWNKHPGGFTSYVINNKDRLSDEFNEDRGNKYHDFNEVCAFLREYESVKELPEGIKEILSIINALENPTNDVVQIIIAAVLKACYPQSSQVNKIVENILGVALVGVFIFLFISILSRR